MVMKLDAEQRRALNLLADAGPRGSTAAILMAHGFTAEMLAGLVRDGLATVATETVKAGGRTIEVAREDQSKRSVAFNSSEPPRNKRTNQNGPLIQHGNLPRLSKDSKK
jgi:hypothetical protein